MNYYDARQIQGGPNAGKWHYTCRNDDLIYPVGHCGLYIDCPTCEDRMHNPDCELCKGHGCINNPSPCPGHDTSEGACEHYREYLLDNARFDQLNESSQHKCEICGDWTQKLASVPSDSIYHDLCDKHCNREGLATVMPAVGYSFGS